MGSAKKKKGKKNKGKQKEVRTRIILDTPKGMDAGYQAYSNESNHDPGIFIGKEDVHLIHNAMREYTPTHEEEHLHSVWLEEFEEMLVVDYGEPYPDAN